MLKKTKIRFCTMLLLALMFKSSTSALRNGEVEQALNKPQSRDGEIREALIRLGRPAVPALIENLRTYSFPMVIVEALGEIGDGRAVPALLSLLEDNEPFSEVAGNHSVDRSFIIKALRKIGDNSAEPLLAEIFYNEKTFVGTRLLAASALARFGTHGNDAKAKAFIMEVAKDYYSFSEKYWHPAPLPPDIIFQDMAEVVYEVKTPESKRLLIDRLLKGTLSYEQSTIIELLSKRPDEDVVEAFLDFCEMPDEEGHIQLQAARALLAMDIHFRKDRLLKAFGEIKSRWGLTLAAELDELEAKLKSDKDK